MTLAFLTRMVISAIIIALISLIARRSPGMGALIASLPMVTTLSVIWMWHDTQDTRLIADFVSTSLIYWLPSIPMFVLMPYMLRHGVGFWPALGAGVVVTFGCFVLTTIVAGRYGVKL